MNAPATSSAPRPPRGAARGRRALRGDLNDRELAAVLLGAAAVVLGGLLLYPILNVLYSSFFVQRLTEPWANTGVPTLENFAQMLRDARFHAALANTLLFALFTVTGSFLVGLPLALLANVETRWRWLVRVALLLPWAMPQVFTALMFGWMFNSDYGVVNDVLGRLGLGQPLWLIRPDYAVAALVVAIVWKTSSFVALILLGGLQGIPAELGEAARVDGATPAQAFWRVTFPLLRPAIAVALIFRTLSALQLFDVPFAMTQGGPGRATETLGIYAYRVTLQFLDFGYGAALSLGLFAVSLAITVFYLRWIRPEDA